jgi:hypothetical protein
VNEEHVKLPFFISEDDEENNNAKTDPPEPNDEL